MSKAQGFREKVREEASRYAEEARRYQERWRASHPAQAEYWQSVQELFTRGVTSRELRDLVARDTLDTLEFFAREVDFAPLRARPWYVRYPQAAWQVFLAMAYRLSPARRVLFALSVPVLILAWARFLLSQVAHGLFPLSPIFFWLLLAATLLFALLMLELRDKLGLKGDLEIARQIQFGLFPPVPQQQDGIRIHASLRPANTVGGDYFDVVNLGDSRWAIVVGDVSGKGMPAALLMALLQGSLRTLITAGLRGCDLLLQLNRHLCGNIPTNRLITLFYAELNTRTGHVEYVNAGHNSPFLIRADGRSERLPATGMALGILPAATFEGAEARLLPRDRLFLFTDGITEAFDPGEQEYGEERLQAFLEAHPDQEPTELIEGVFTDVVSFCGTARPRDDMTLVVVGREG